MKTRCEDPAKDNDGHYLQHSVELAVPVQLAALSPDKRIHIILTHGMAPFERCDEPRNHQAKKLFHGALANAAKPPVRGESGIVKAYRATAASRQRYPNSGELIASIIGRDRLTGQITEVCANKCRRLQEVWSGFSVAVINSSWRSENVHRSLFPNSP